MKKPKNSKPVKYLKARMEGKTKKDAELEAYGKDNHNSSQIEKSKTYQNAMDFYLLRPEEVYTEHNKNIRQDKDKGAKNKAIDMYYKLKANYPKESSDYDTGELHITIKKND